MSSSEAPRNEAREGAAATVLVNEEKGYSKNLSARQINMIAIGGSIGTGLFLGAGGRLETAGPSLVLSYALCGLFAFFILRALGELVLHRPSSGSFVSYAREFFGEKAAFVSGWFYWVSWATTAIVDITAAALYMNFFGKYVPWIGTVPQWVWALTALVLVLTLNLLSVKVFGELEFWFAFIKVGALVSFLAVGAYFVLFGTPSDGQDVGFALLSGNGGFFPNGLLPMILVMQGVIFAYASIELIGTAAGETKNPEKVMPRAINAVIIRIVVFYVGSVLLLALLLPYTAYTAGESPFVTFFASIGVQGVDTLMNFVVLTAALSSLNAGLYSTGRILRSMSSAGSAPRFANRMSRAGVPYGGILLTAVVALVGVFLNYIAPSEAFETVLNVSAVCIVVTWATIVVCQLCLKHMSDRGAMMRPTFRMIGAPYTGYLTLLFLLFVLVMTFVSSPQTMVVTAVMSACMAAGWFACRRRIAQIAAAREGYTGVYPVVPSPFGEDEAPSARPVASTEEGTRGR